MDFDFNVINFSIINTKKTFSYFMTSGILDFLILLLKTATDDSIKAAALRLIFSICDQSPKNIEELRKRGVPIIINEELIKHTKGIRMVSELTVDLFEAIKIIATTNDIEHSEFNGRNFIQSMKICLSFGKKLVITRKKKRI